MTDYRTKKAEPLSPEDATTYRRWRRGAYAIYGGMILALAVMWGAHHFVAPSHDVQTAGVPLKEASHGEPATLSQ